MKSRARRGKTSPRAASKETQDSSRLTRRPPENKQAPSYEILFNSSPEPMWIWDRETYKFLDVNEAAVRKYGYSIAEFKGMTLKDIRPAEDVALFLREAQQPKEGLWHVGLRRHLLKNGRVIEVDVMTHIIQYNGRSAQLSMLRDLSHHKKLEEELKGAQQHLRAIIANAPIFLFAVDAKGIFTLSEGRGLEALNLRPGQIVGCSIFDLYRGHPQVPANILRALKGEAFSSTVEISGVVFDTRYTPMKDGAGQVVGVIGVATDVTARWRAQQERDLLLSRERVARAEAEAANRAKDEFLAVLSHELRTPMTAMIGWTWMLRSKPMDEENFARALSIIERNMKVQAQIIEDLLDISSLRSGKLRLQTRLVDLIPILQNAANSVRPIAESKSIQLTSDFIPGECKVVGDPERLGQIVWNLLSNSVKFTPEGGTVHLQLRENGENYEINVSDTGEGISPDFLPHLFGLFRQAEPSITRKHRGLGLGLAIVWDLVELHGGIIKAFSEGVGKGSTFTVSLPLGAKRGLPAPAPVAEVEAKEHVPRGHIEAIPMLNDIKVLIVDDESDVRETLATILENYGALVSAVSSCSEALQALPKTKPHVLISDIVMPVEDGYTLIKKLRALAPEHGGDTPAIALTAYAQAEDRTRALLAGFNIYVQKPVEPAELAAAIANLTGRTRAARSS